MEGTPRKIPTAPVHPKEARTYSLPTTATNINTQVRLEPLSSPYYIRPIGNSVGILKNPVTPLEFTEIPSSLTQRPSPRGYSRNIKISSARGVTIYNLQRSDDGTLAEFKPLPSQNTIDDTQKDSIKTADTFPTKKKSIPPATAAVSARATTESSGFGGFKGGLGALKSDFFRIVNDALNEQQKQILEEKALLRKEKALKGESPRKLKAKKTIFEGRRKRNASVELKALNPEEKEIIRGYEHEVLGSYFTPENRPSVISKKLKKKLDYLQDLKRNLVDEDTRVFLIKMLQSRKSIKRALAEKDLKKVMNELNLVLNLTIEIDDMYLFLEVLHLISDTYYDFGELDNALFAYNQLRMACELSNNLVKKIISFIGMAETCKRLGYFSQALLILKRALQFAWHINDYNKECQIYDLLGIIYYTQGEIESANYYHEKCVESKIESENSPLKKITKEEIKDYIKHFHQSFTSIEPTLFTKLSITYKPRRFKAINSKLNKEKLRTFLHIEGQKDDNYLESEAKLTKASIFIEKLLLKARRHQEANFFSTEPSREIGTLVSAAHQLDVIVAEPDFERNITSPRSFYKKKDQEGQKASKSIKTENIATEPAEGKGNDKRSYKYLVRKVKISDAQYLDQKKDRNKYSLKQIFKEKDLTFKSVDDRVEMHLHKSDSAFSFEDLRKKFKSQYTANPVNSKLFMGHLTPNRTTYGFASVIEIKPSRCNAFFDDAFEYFVNKRNIPVKESKKKE